MPSDLGNCVYLNSLKLSGNALSGKIPASLSRLSRLRTLDLSHNGDKNPASQPSRTQPPNPPAVAAAGSAAGAKISGRGGGGLPS
ncbi:hypothetical protein QYE76_060371 [Lolium multiflorum]|uniref:Uncharacterized protein n=1 Tax=Lolium multiflorum TaxID=4521 RepID=A0AAD8RZX9_LOLMU|nr:hypothetical protein QYE76_060371 [Lolium multiflorum]